MARGCYPAPWTVTLAVEVLLLRFPVGDLALGLVLADAVGVLDLADQLVALARDAVEVVVGELAPLLLRLALQLLPVAFDAIPVHAALLCNVVERNNERIYSSARARWQPPESLSSGHRIDDSGLPPTGYFSAFFVSFAAIAFSRSTPVM